MLSEDGLMLIKLWFSIDAREQKQRLQERSTNPLKRWKLSTVDAKAQEKWQDFTHYKNKMFKHTSTQKNPWVIVKGNNKSQARLEAMRYVLNKIDYTGKGETDQRLRPDPTVVEILKD
jgi:polyphosphate kinase 2 (PPK2 family)